MVRLNFDLAAERDGEDDIGVSNDIDLEIDLGEEYGVHMASPPTSGQLALFMRSQASESGDIVNGLFDFLEATLDDDGYAAVKRAMKHGDAQMTILPRLVNQMVEQWTARPSTPSSGSSGSRKSTGNSSTGNKRPAAKKRSASR